MQTKKESKKLNKEQRVLEMVERGENYKVAATWQVMLLPMNSVANITFMILMMYVSYYAAGPVGLGTVTASLVITGSRFFDAITDPIVGFILDRTHGKFGKVRPFFVLGYLLLSISTIVMFFTAHLVPESIRLIYFIMLYGVYVLGYTFTSIAGISAGPILTNDPKQRPLIGGLASIYITIFATGIGMLIPLYLVPKYGGFNNVNLFQELVIIVVIAAGIFYSLAIAAIWSDDTIEKLENGDSVLPKMKTKDIWKIIKGNQPLQLFMISAISDKFAQLIANNAVIAIMLFGIIIGDYSISGYIQPATMVVNAIAIIFAVRYAGRVGLKKGYLFAIKGGIVVYTSLILLLWLGDPSQIGFNQIGFMTIAFFTLFILAAGFNMASNATSGPMLSDVIDYQTYISGRFTPGTISSIQSFIDKMISAIAPTIVGLVVAAIGFREAFPDIDTPYSNSILWVTLSLAYGSVIIGWIISIIAMKYYPLTLEKMEEIQGEIKVRRNKPDTEEKQVL